LSRTSNGEGERTLSEPQPRVLLLPIRSLCLRISLYPHLFGTRRLILPFSIGVTTEWNGVRTQTERLHVLRINDSKREVCMIRTYTTFFGTMVERGILGTAL
jgi:hypothetical protein